MKKQDKHPIDNLFKENIHQDFPYDPALWNKADKGIAALFNRKRILYFSLLLLLFMSSVVVFVANTSSKPEKISRTGNSGNTSLNKKNVPTKASNYKNSSDEVAIHSSIEKTEVESTVVVSNPDMEKESPTTSKNGKEEGINYEETKDNKKEETVILDVDKEDNLIEATTNEKQKTDYAEFVLSTKPLEFFAFNAFGKNPEPASKIKEPKKRKFATFIEFENLNSVFKSNELKGLSKNELDYRNKYEKVQNYTSYSLNIIMQRGGFGFITGLGYATVAVKTSYITTSKTFDFSEAKYKMLDDSVHYTNGTPWSNIREYRDTIATHSEQRPLKDQASQNVFQWVQVPLKFSYQKSLYRLRFSARLGADVMWLYNFKGKFINTNLDGFNSEEKLKPLNVNASGQIMAGYQLNHKIQIGGSFYINQQLSSNFTNYNSRFKSEGYGLYVRWGL